MVETPSAINTNGNSRAAILILECDHKILVPYFDSRAGEILQHRQEWSKLTVVNPVLYTPGPLNPADIYTKGKTTTANIAYNYVWQLGPKYLQFDVKNSWPISRTFSAVVPDEYKLVRNYLVQGSSRTSLAVFLRSCTNTTRSPRFKGS